MSRIQGGIGKNPFGPDWGTARARAGGEAQSVGAQVQTALFGRPPPRRVEPDDALLTAIMARMHAWRRRLARLAGDEEDDYDLALATGVIAMIDEGGLVYLGREFLLENVDEQAVLVGVLAHEIGHRPKRWHAYQTEKPVSRAEAEKICRAEETRADYFSGRALAELKLTPGPLCAFLEAVQTSPHPEYFSVEIRTQVIHEGFEDGARRRVNRKKLFPDLHRMTSPDGDLGSG